MDLRFGPQEEAFRQEVRAYLKATFTPELLKELEERETLESRGPLTRAFIKKMGRDGWLAVGWPKAYGGQGRSWWEQFIFYEELWYLEPTFYYAYPLVPISIVGPAIMEVGTEWQKKEFLPPILRGELEFALGLTEPEAGSDLASLQTRAVRDGDDYVINGQKVFTSNGDRADYIWLAARTNPNVPKHKGLSVFLMDTRLPGFSWTPITTWHDVVTTAGYYDNVRIPARYRVGEENRGWEYMTLSVDNERVALGSVAIMQRDIDDLIQWARETRCNGKPVSQDPWVQDMLADMVVQLEVARQFSHRIVWLISQGGHPHVDIAMVKVFTSEFHLRMLNIGLQIMGMFGMLEPHSKWAPLKGRLEHTLRSRTYFTFSPGANESFRDIIGWRGLGLPRIW